MAHNLSIFNNHNKHARNIFLLHQLLNLTFEGNFLHSILRFNQQRFGYRTASYALEQNGSIRYYALLFLIICKYAKTNTKKTEIMKKILLYLIACTFTATALVATPKAIVFDFGGVLTGEPNREAVVSFLQKSFHMSKDEFEGINREKRLAVKQGKTDEEFWLSYAKTKGIELPS